MNINDVQADISLLLAASKLGKILAFLYFDPLNGSKVALRAKFK